MMVKTTLSYRPFLITLIVIMIFAIPLLCPYYFWNVYHSYEKHTLINGAQIGCSEKDVVSRLGKPVFAVNTMYDIPDIESWEPIPSCGISGKLLVYQFSRWRIYVYVNRNNIVENAQLSRA